MRPALAEDWQAGGFGIYIHWPFCAAKCPYCDFNSHVARGIDQARWRAAYLREIDRVARDTPGREVRSVFFGGGTPSLMDPETVETVLSAIARRWSLAGDLEVTLEANPTSVEAEKFRRFRGAGVTRLSMGVQALNDQDLRALGRMHSAAEALAAFEIARDSFERVSFDLIYARQHQRLADWEAELRRAADLAVDHLSLYQLTIEPGTRFGDLAARNRLRGLPDADLSADMYAVTRDVLAACGLPAYEISNHAAPGAECRHNLVYWRYGDYAGIGPGAHGRLTIDGLRWATSARSAPQDWLACIEADAIPEHPRDSLSAQEQGEEMLMMGLRLTEGVSLARHLSLTGTPLDQESLASLAEDGFVSCEDERLRLTQKGRPVANSVLKMLLVQ